MAGSRSCDTRRRKGEQTGNTNIDLHRRASPRPYYQDQAQREAAEASKAALQKSGRFEHIYTEVVPAGQFYVAEEYHQDYYKKNPIRYSFYRKSCGRDARVEQVWNLKH